MKADPTAGAVQRWVRSATRFPAAVVFAASLLWALVVTWPLVLHLGDAMYGYPGDGLGTIADFWWFNYALHHGANLLYNDLRGVPLGSGWEVVYFDVLQVGIFAPLSFVVGPIAAYNLGMLISFPLTAWTTFLLGRRLGLSVLASAFAAVTFAFVPYHQEKAMVHLMQTHMELFPAFLYFAVRWRQTGRWWTLLASGVVGGLALWTDPSIAYLLAVVVAIFFATSMVGRPAGRSWRDHLQAHAVAAGTMAVVAAVFFPAVLAVSARGGILHPGSLAGQFTTASRSVSELGTYSARIREYLLPWHLNPLVPKALQAYEKASLHGSSFAESTLTVGYTVIALAAFGLAFAKRNYALLLAAGLVVVGYVMTQPPEREIFGISIPGPSHFLFPLLPIIRVYSRFAMLVFFGAALTAGLGYAVFETRLQSSRRWLLFVPFVLVAIEFNGLPPSHLYQILPAPAEYTWLKAQPAGTLIEYPIAVRSSDPQVGTDIEVTNRVYVLYQQVHEHPMFNGATPGSVAATKAFELEPYYAAGVSDQLRALGIRYVFVHRAAYSHFGRDPDLPLSGYQHVKALDDTDIYVLTSG